MNTAPLTPDLTGTLTRFWRSELYDLVTANLAAFSRLVKRKRETIGWSQRDLARQGGIARSVIQDIERQVGVPEHRTVRILEEGT